ncbi:MAG: hypothetical protein U5L03_16285 [Burkholderiaceae bacterium]|nr:hypothetical protein [Burkholderiaceae bacterium]
MSLAHTLRWNAVTTGGIGNNGVGNNSVGVYRIVISAPDGGELDYPFTSSNSVNRFLLPPGANCAGGGTCSWVIPANTLGSNEGYIVQIEARDDSDANNRSITRKFALNVPVTDTYGAVLPVSRSVQVGQTATAFATILNAGSSPAYDCAIAPITSIPADFSYQTTDPLTNAVIGQPNTPVNLDVGGAQTFVFAFTPTAPVSPTDVQLEFKCLNSDAAPIYANVNTLLFSADSSPVPDVIALAATSNNDGIVNIPGSIGTGFFAVATANVGAASTITASADTGAATLPVTLWLCQTNPGTGACLAPLTPTVTTTIGAGETPTFAVFVAGSGSVPFDPANNRVIVRFRDGANVVRGATSVAVRSQ